MIPEIKKKRLFYLAFAAVVFCSGLGVGYLLHKHRSWMRVQGSTDEQLEVSSGRLKSTEVSTIETTLTRMTKTVTGLDGSLGLSGYGGGLSAVGSACLGVDRKGQFFVYRGTGDVVFVDIGLDFNLSKYLNFLKATSISEWWFENQSQDIAVLGLATREENGGLGVYLCHDYWLPDAEGKTQRVSRLFIEDIDGLLDGSLSIDSSQWELLVELGPVFPFETVQQSPFTTNHRGGRMVFSRDGNLLLTTGDHRLNGKDNPVLSSQDAALLHGKILKVDLETKEVSIFASGMRNPQGLYLDGEGTLWQTEHGPKGGDELNRIVGGGNYGWPLVTLGVDYADFSWPLAERKGRHDGFVEPVFAWLPSIAVSNLLRIQGSPLVWDGDLLIASLLEKSVFRARISDGRVQYVERIEIGERIRDLVQLETGQIVLFTDSGKLIELRETPASEAPFPTPFTEREREAGLVKDLAQCVGCHDFSDKSVHRIGPPLWGVYGRAIGSIRFSGYSEALRSKQGRWGDETLSRYLVDPNSFAPGTTMPAAHLDPKSVERVVGYLSRLK